MVVAGCTTMSPVEMSSDALRAAIRAGEVGQPGQQVIAVTADGERHAFAFQRIDAAEDVIRWQAPTGEAVSVAIKDIVALRVRATAGGQTRATGRWHLVYVALALAADAAEDFVDIFNFK